MLGGGGGTYLLGGGGTFLFIVIQNNLFSFLNVYPSCTLKHMLKVCLFLYLYFFLN